MSKEEWVERHLATMRAGGSVVFGPRYWWMNVVTLGGLVASAALIGVAFTPEAYQTPDSNKGQVLVSSGMVGAIFGPLVTLVTIAWIAWYFLPKRLVLDACGIAEEQRMRGVWRPLAVRDRHAPDGKRTLRFAWQDVADARTHWPIKGPRELHYTLRATRSSPERTFGLDDTIGGNRKRLATLFRAAIREFGTPPGTPSSAARGPWSRRPD